MRGHVDDCLPNGQPVFSRGCPEFEVTTPGGVRLLVLVNLLKSKGYGGTAAANARRKAQAERVAQIQGADRQWRLNGIFKSGPTFTGNPNRLACSCISTSASIIDANMRYWCQLPGEITESLNLEGFWCLTI